MDEKASKALYDNTTINVGRKANTTIGARSATEGSGTTASGSISHAEGANTIASGNESHAGGLGSEAIGYTSFAHGHHTIANNDYEIAFGRHNSSNSDTLFSIGDGLSPEDRHNAFEITTNGGKLYDKDIATMDDIPTSLPANGGNADTINNHTVNADVPENAVFTDTIYDDTQIKSDIANKVDKVSGKSLSTNDLTNTLKSNYDKAYTHSQSTHARTDATKVEKSATNGNIKINGTETVVYTHPSGTNPHGTTKSDVGLGNVGNFKAVSTVAN